MWNVRIKELPKTERNILFEMEKYFLCLFGNYFLLPTMSRRLKLQNVVEWPLPLFLCFVMKLYNSYFPFVALSSFDGYQIKVILIFWLFPFCLKRKNGTSSNHPSKNRKKEKNMERELAWCLVIEIDLSKKLYIHFLSCFALFLIV